MVLYTCEKCKKVFNRKCNYIDHIEKKKNPCKPNNIIIIDNPAKIPQNILIIPQNTTIIEQNNENAEFNVINNDFNTTPINNDINTNIINSNIIKNENVKKYVCNYCYRNFSRSDHLKKHLTERCKIRKEENKDKEELLQLLLKQSVNQQEQINNLVEDNKKLSSLITKLSTTTTTSNTNNINNTNTNSNNNINSNNSITNIKIEFGKEELKKIDKSVFYNALLKGSGAEIPSKLIEGIHFNENYKEYQNVYISDASRNKALVHNGKIWNIANADEVVDRLLDTTLIYAGSKHEELENEIAEKPKSVKNKITKEIKLMNLMKGKEEFEVDNDGNHIDIDGKIVDKKEFERGERLNIRAKEKIKLTLCNKKYIINKSDK